MEEAQVAEAEVEEVREDSVSRPQSRARAALRASHARRAHRSKTPVVAPWSVYC